MCEKCDHYVIEKQELIFGSQSEETRPKSIVQQARQRQAVQQALSLSQILNRKYKSPDERVSHRLKHKMQSPFEDSE